MECTYCKDNHCGFKEIINCKHRELMEENSNLDKKLQEMMVENDKLTTLIGKFREMVKPILELADDAFQSQCVQVVNNAKKYYKEQELEND